MKFIEIDKCVACKSYNRKNKFSYVGFQDITFSCFKCKNCGLVYASPIPILNEESLNEIYSSDYYYNYFGNDSDYLNDDNLINSVIKKELNKEFEIITKYIDNKNSSKKVLDVGCGDGRFLGLFKKQGWDCSGIEPSETIRKIAKSNGFEILDTTFLNIDSDSISYDCIIMDNVIEHLDYPNLYIAKIYKLLSEGGTAVLKTPNASSFVERLETYFLTLSPIFLSNFLMKFLKRKFNVGSGAVHRFGNLHPPVHLSIFNKKSITKSLINAGFNNNDITVLIGSEYYYKWRVEETKPSSFLGYIMKFIKQLGDVFGMGDRLFVIVKKS